MTIDQVRRMLKAACEKAGGQGAWAKQHGLSAAYVCDVLRGNRTPGPSICGPLGVEAERVRIFKKVKP